MIRTVSSPSGPRARGICQLALVLAAVFLPHAVAAQATLTILDRTSQQPVEGALVFAPGELRVFRSDRRGQVELPAGYGAGGVRIHSTHHAPEVVEAGRLHGTALLTFDAARSNPLERAREFTRADSLRGTYGPYRENNDLLTYDLDVTVQPAEGFIHGSNTIRFRMLEDGRRIQFDLFENMHVDSIMHGGRRLSWEREHNAVFIVFHEPLRAGAVHEVAFHWSGRPQRAGRFGGMVFQSDSLGNPWVYTANQNIGASVWWPNKDQQPDEVDSMTIRVTVPSDLVAVSNGRLRGREDVGNGQVRYTWHVSYPINNYSVALNIGKYVHFGEVLGDLTLDYWVMPYNLKAARRQFSQTAPMLECFQQHFGEYPFVRDGFKLIEVPYAGMEHQSAIAYGNQFRNGYLGRDWTGVGISPRFDFIIIHESGHEWFGNSVTANDVSDAWIHEGFTTYGEVVYVECMWGYDDAVLYVNGLRDKVANREPIIGPSGVNHWPTQDQYFKGALFLHTLRHVIDDDEAWWPLLRGFAEHFAYQNIWTADVISYFSETLGRDLRPIFEQYLYHARLPVLELQFAGDSVRYRWDADVADFDMPVSVRAGGAFLTIHPRTEWQVLPLHGVTAADWQPATDRFYIDVRTGAGAAAGLEGDS
jgi:aminopeptidase N